MGTGEAHFLNGGGAVGALMRSHVWQNTPLGDPADWPQSLRSAVSIMLNSRYPIALYWGPELALLYNDAWSPIPGNKHPWAMGRPGREVWPEIWDRIGPLFEQVRETGEGIWQQDELLPMLRHGYLEECYYNFTFSPVRGEDGTIDGIFNAVLETTDRVLSERRLHALSRLGQRASASLNTNEACSWAINILAENRVDVPFALLYLREGERFRLSAPGGELSESLLNRFASSSDLPWPLLETEKQSRVMVMPAPPQFDLKSSFWSEPVTEIVIAPVRVAGEDRAGAFLVAGANPRRRVDASYSSFFELAAGHIGTAIATAQAYENERRRVEAFAEIDRAKTAFFSNVSHEFRTPLTLMLGPLEDALAAATATDQRERLEVAQRNALRLLRLVNALLDFSRLEAGRVEANFQATDLAAATSELASSFRSATDRAGLGLIVETEPLRDFVYVDRDMWEKIVLNLLSNAFKFTHHGEIAVRLRELNDKVELSVRDTGVGIPPSELPKLFDRFHRVEGAQGRSFEGSGIGLALVQELVKLHGGKIEVDSEPGRGTCFTVTLPFGLGHLPPDRVLSVASNEPIVSRSQAFVEEALRWLPNAGRPMRVQDEVPLALSAYPIQSTERARVLLVDDNADLRDYIARLLSESEYEVETAADGEAGFSALGQRGFDLVITDVMMPKLDGFGLVRAIRAEQKFHDLPVIMLSARAGEEATIEGLDAGADDYLTKPFSARELLARVSANIKMARIRAEAAAALRASEQRLQELNSDLERRVAEALAERRILADIVEGTDAFVQVVDLDFCWLAINKAAADEFEQIFGVRPKVGDRMLELLAHLPAEREAVRTLWARALAGEEFTEVSAFGDPGRDRRFYEMKYNTLRNARGEQIGAYQFVYDVTKRIEEQERLASAEEQLRQAQKMEAMGQLTGGVAHDFNNLLTPIVGALDALRRKGIGGEREQKLIAGAVQSADRAKTLVQRLLAFARRQPLQATAIDVGGLVRGMSDLISSTTGPQIKVSIEIADGLPPAKADPNQLELALLNLAVNARDAMPDGGTLRLSAGVAEVGPGHRCALAPGHYLHLSVADTGTGMDEATVVRAVEPFFSTKGIGKGTGLGLSMAHGLASQLGGALTIQSQRGVGTNVELWLPLSNDQVRDERGDEKANELEQRPGRALLVDDDELVRATAADMLSDLGYEVIEAGSAEEALRFIRKGLAPKLFITDHLMPGMTGTDVARIVRSEAPDVKILLISGYAEADGVAPDLPRLTKPFRIDELAAKLASFGID